MNRIRLSLFAVVLLMTSGVISFELVDLLYDSSASAQVADAAEGKDFWNLSSVEEAEQIAGYAIASPEFLPEGFVPGENILVNQPIFANLPKIVQRFWADRANPAYNFSLMQDPSASEIGGGEPATINGFAGSRRLLPADSLGRTLPLLVLSWRDGDFTYYLRGHMGGSFTEETLLKIAASIRSE